MVKAVVWIILKEISLFLKSPPSSVRGEMSAIQLVKENMKLYLTHVLLFFFIALPVIYIKSLFNIYPRETYQEDNSIIYVITFLMLPLIEEITFRLSLFYSMLNLSMSLSALITSFFFLFIDIIDYLWISLMFLVLCGILYLILRNSNIFDLRLRRFWIHHCRFVLFFSIFVFSFMHMLNCEFSANVLLLMPIIILPQIISAIIYSYARMSFGFFSGFVQHLAFNFSLVIPILILNYYDAT